jgi:leader peptidase (prepilin peptidase)/N-methyltransferase
VLAPPSAPVFVDPFVVEVLVSPWARIGAFVFGLLFGSFANVVIHRIPRGLSIVHPRSRCPGCEKPIAFYDNIPVISYIVLRGRCRHCATRFGPRYLVVELLGGILAFSLYALHVLAPLLEGGGTEGVIAWLAWFFFCMALVIVTYTDLDVWVIPDEVVLPIGVAGLAFAFFWPELLGVPVWESGAAAVTGFALVWGVRFAYLRLRGIEAMGLGDGKLLFMAGAFFGFPGLVWTLGAGALQGLIVSVPMLLLGRDVANTKLEEVHGDDPELGKEDEDAGITGKRVPFGPFLALAALEYVLLRRQLDALVALVLPG